MTTEEPARVKRRTPRATQAEVDGTRGKKEVGTAKTEATATRVSACRRFVMRGHTVKIVNPREGWECMKGSYATVIEQFPDNLGALVEMTRPGRDKKEKSCFACEEIEMVPMGDTLRHADTEEYRLIIRSVALSQMPKWGGPDGQPLSDNLKADVMRRSERLQIPVRDIQRIARHDLRWQAAMTAMGLSNFCTAIVPYTGGTH
jgi:hypothetical protein